MNTQELSSNFDDNTLYVLDSYALIYRSYYAFISRPLINKDGINISAVFGFFRTLHALLTQYTPHYFVAAFDSRVRTFRHEMYPEYKATRQKTPEDLHAQIPIIEEILGALGIPVVRQDGYEADDVIATIAARCCQEKRCCRIISSDKDLMQLIGGFEPCKECCDCVQLLRPRKTGGGWDAIGSAEVTAEWGVSPDKMLDILSLVGDAADNVPGVKGIGEKTAVKLIAEFGSLDGIYAHIDAVSGSTGKKLAEGRESAYFSRDLIKLRYDADVSTNFSDFCITSLDRAAAARILVREGAVAVARQYYDLDGLPLVSDSSAIQKTGSEQSLSQVPTSGEVRHMPPLSESDDIPVSLYRENPGIYTAVTTEPELVSIIDHCIACGFCAFDCETTSVDMLTAVPVGFSIAWEAGTSWYIPLRLSSLTDSGTVCIAKDVAVRELNRLFAEPSLTVAMHNGKYDCTVMSRWGVAMHLKDKKGCTLWDTMIAAWLLSPERSSFSLDSLAGARLGIRTLHYSDIVSKNETFDQVELSVAVRYAAEDADITLQLATLMEPMLKEAGLYSLFTDIEMPLVPVLAEMEQTGIRIMPQELYDYGIELDAQLLDIEQAIYRSAGHSFNIASPKQLQTVLFDELKLPSGKKTKTGYSTDSSVLEELASLHAVPSSILQYRQLAKLKTTYVDTLPRAADADDRIHTSFIQTGTATGRLSSRDPNLQNIPIRDEAGRRIRAAFGARNNCQLISADYSQIELVVLAHLSQDPNMCASFTSGEDVHRRTAGLIFNTDPESVTPEMRRAAKTINFGVMYGMSAFRLSNELGISRSDAQSFITAYFATYRGIRCFMDSVIEHAQKDGYVETIMGRRRYVPDITSGNKMVKSGAERIAVNTPIQGSAADIVKLAMLAVDRKLRSGGYTSRLLLQVHDELILESPEAEVSEVRALLKDTMESVIKLSVPLWVSIESGLRWGDFH